MADKKPSSTVDLDIQTSVYRIAADLGTKRSKVLSHSEFLDRLRTQLSLEETTPDGLKRLDASGVSQTHVEFVLSGWSIPNANLLDVLGLVRVRPAESRSGLKDPWISSADLALTMTLATENQSIVPLSGRTLSSSPAFQEIVSRILETLGASADYTGELFDDDGCDEDDEPHEDEEIFERGSALRYFVAEIFMAGLIHAKLFDSEAFLQPFGLSERAEYVAANRRAR